MARGLGWSPEAIEDIEAIASYIERDSPWYAKAVASKIVETAETIPEAEIQPVAGARPGRRARRERRGDDRWRAERRLETPSPACGRG